MYINPTTLSNQSNPAPGLLLLPEEFLPEYFKEGKRAAGFVKIEHDGTKVTSCVWDEEAYQAWCEANPEQPDPEPELTVEERVTNIENAIERGFAL